MHLDIILKTLDVGQGRFELCHQVFKAIHKLHKPGNRIEDTTNTAFQMLSDEKRQQALNNTRNADAGVFAA